MASELDMTSGKAGLAFRGTTPWHQLGHRLDASASMEDWRKSAGLDWTCERAPVYFDCNEEGGTKRPFAGKDVLFRSDTRAPLSVVSNDYQIAQPIEVMDFFAAITKNGQFEMETAGSLFEGRRIWALARVGENANILDDQVAPYVMLATSYDGTMSTVAQFTSIRVVCNNTLNYSLRNNNGKNRVTVPHSAMFNPLSVMTELGLAQGSWEEFISTARQLAKRKLTNRETDLFLQELLNPETLDREFQPSPEKVRKSKGYRRIMDLFNGGQLGSGQDAIFGTAWGMLQATTEFIDWEAGRDQNRRLNDAWFGAGAKLKSVAGAILQSIA